MPRGVDLRRVFLKELEMRGVSVERIDKVHYSIGGLKCYVKYANFSKHSNSYWFGFPKEDVHAQVSESMRAILLCGQRQELKTIFLMPFSILADFLRKHGYETIHEQYHCSIYPARNYQMVARREMEMQKYEVSIDEFKQVALAPEAEPPKKRQDEVQKPPEEQPPVELDHEELILHLLELGEINEFKVDTEYSCDAYRLDATWLTDYSEVPKYCFEVHISGSLHKDIAALKHAYDKWNSKIFLICTGEDLEKCKRLISGSFHEIANRIKILDAKEFLEYCQFKEKFKEINGLFG